MRIVTTFDIELYKNVNALKRKLEDELKGGRISHVTAQRFYAILSQDILNSKVLLEKKPKKRRTEYVIRIKKGDWF